MANSTQSKTKKSSESTGSKAKALVIVESPAKAKTINKYLGDDYVVRSSIGHVRDLPTSGSGSAKAKANTDKTISREEKARLALIRRMGIDPDNKWKATYEILPNKTKVIKELKSLAKDAETIYLATDMDREGEAIAWHLKEVIGGGKEKYQRVVFNEITKTAIQNAFQQPTVLNQDRVDAQQARRFLDRVVGYMVSPLLWSKVARGLSAGRVQSVATRLVVEREREIRAFVPVEYWQIHADTNMTGDETPLRLEASKQGGKTLKLANKAETDSVLEVLKNNPFTVSSRTQKATQSKPSAPFITSTLQQSASTRLGFSVKKTMMMAQRLYEAGYITYMRTDSTFLSADALTSARHHIETTYGKDYLPTKANVYGNKQNAQEAHEAIRPSNVDVKATQLVGVDPDAKRLYELIWRQFVACQMTPAKYLSISLLVQSGDVELKARGRTMTFDGYTKVQQQKSDDTLLPDVKEGEVLNLVKLDPSQHFTKPTARYTEASLVKELEKRGIGRPSTYASTISTIQDRGYVRLENKRLFAEKMGDIVTERLVESFPDLMDYTFTAGLEDKLDLVAEGNKKWKKLLDEFYGDFKIKLDRAKGKDGMRPNNPTDLPDVFCEQCERPMQIRTGSTGVFLGCTGYNLPPKERCKNTKNLIHVDNFTNMLEGDDADAEIKDLMEKKRCPICSTAMDGYIVDGGLKLHICGNNPDCAGYILEKGTFEVAGSDAPTIDCNKCDAQMELKSGRFGAYFACQSKECGNTRKVMKNGEPAPPRMDPIDMPELKSVKHDDHYILREGAAGIFLAASKFPKIRETRPPKLAELRPIKSQMEEKFHYLFDAPDEDPDGNPTILRWSRKKAEQYVGSLNPKTNKATRWGLYWRGNKWVEE